MRQILFSGEVKRSRAALWSARLSLFAAALIAIGILLHRLFGMTTPTLLNIVSVGFAMTALGIVLAIVGFARIWSKGLRGTGAATAGALVGLTILAWPAAYVPTVISQAPLNDVTTDTTDPPPFKTAANLRPVGANALDYGGRAASRVQEALYPDLRPLIVERTARETFELTVQALKREGLTVVAEIEPNDPEPGYIEATARTLVIGFTDDIVIRIIGRGGRAKVDVRSASRWGIHDFGRNAERVRDIIRGILERLQSTVPASGSRS